MNFAGALCVAMSWIRNVGRPSTDFHFLFQWPPIRNIQGLNEEHPFLIKLIARTVKPKSRETWGLVKLSVRVLPEASDRRDQSLHRGDVASAGLPVLYPVRNTITIHDPKP